MKKWAMVAVVAVLAVGGGAAWALTNRGDGQSSGTPSLAERIASIDGDPSPPSNLVADRCYDPLPLFDSSGGLSPELAAFPARLLDNDFELTAIRFGNLCFGATPTKMLETEWKHRKTGVALMVDQYSPSTTPTRIAPLYATFSDGGYDFYLTSFNLYGYPQPAKVDAATTQRTVEMAVEQLRPPVPLSCFYRSVSKDWSDLAVLGIGDPRSAIPDGYSAVKLEFTSLEQPGAGCPTTAPPPSAEPAVQFQAMFSGPGGSLLALFARSLTPDEFEMPATFGPGGVQWKSDHYRFSMNWAPEHVNDEQARTIARALDPGFDGVCALSARRVEFADLQQRGVREPVRPGGAPSAVTGVFVVVGRSPRCSDAGAEGFQAHWIMEYRDRAGLVDVTALGGDQLPDMRPLVLEGTLYWKRPDVVSFYVSGLKAEFSREELLGIAGSVDPVFDESLLTAPPPP